MVMDALQVAMVLAAVLAVRQHTAQARISAGSALLGCEQEARS